MTQAERRQYLIRYLLNESVQYKDLVVPTTSDEQKMLLRSLFNIRMPKDAPEEFLRIQDEYLQEENKQKGITDYHELTPMQKGIYLWQGDISTLKVGAIVNAANSQMLGCFYPNHKCIDNCIHTFAGIKLRKACEELMIKQGHEEETGQAKITGAYNLPADYVIHTVGPIVQGRLTKKHEDLLASCYTSCLKLAEENKIQSIAFCCISTGVFMFPNKRAAQIAVETVTNYKKQTGSKIEVIFNVFKEEDLQIYKELLR
ncbi:putative ADP-ribose binding module [Lachnospiraceae bacterium TWA4]|nr:putative ADP-ribose binding module [Lachnospiraceae bacterium TWA4]